MAFKMKGSPAKMGTIKGTTAHRSALRQQEGFSVEEVEKKKDLGSFISGIFGEKAIEGRRQKQRERHEGTKYEGMTHFEKMWAKRKEARIPEWKRKYDARKVKKTESKDKKSSSTYQEPDPSTEIKGLTGGPSYEWKTQERTPSDLKEQDRRSFSKLPSAPGDEWKYEIDHYDDGTRILWAEDPDGELHLVEPGSKSDKAIRKRYTGSETGDLSNWYGHDTSGYSSSYDVDPVSGEIIDESFSSTDFERKSYLPYDLAQKHYNPNYQQLENEKNKIASEKGTENYEYSKAAEAVNIANASKTDVVKETAQSESIEAKIESLKREKEQATNLMEKGKIISEIKKLQAELRRQE